MRNLNSASPVVLVFSTILLAGSSMVQADSVAVTPGTYDRTHSTKDLAASHTPVQREIGRPIPQPAGRKPLPSSKKSVAPVKDQKGSNGDMSRDQALKMQMEMDRMSKTQQTMSNILKKNSDTQSAITENIK